MFIGYRINACPGIEAIAPCSTFNAIVAALSANGVNAIVADNLVGKVVAYENAANAERTFQIFYEEQGIALGIATGVDIGEQVDADLAHNIGDVARPVIDACARVDSVRPKPADEIIVATFTAQGIISAIAVQGVGTVIADQDVALGERPIQVFDADECIALGMATRRNACEQADID